jgi:hypothetical protein
LRFDLVAGERAFLRERLGSVSHPHLPGERSLLSRLIRHGLEPPKTFWDPAVLSLADKDARPLLRAKAVSSLAAIGRGVYAALVETLRDEEDGLETSRRHRDNLRQVLDAESPTALKLAGRELAAVHDDIPGLPLRLVRVMEETLAWIQSGRGDPMLLMEPYRAVEQRKVRRARLPMTGDGQARRGEWTPEDHPLAEGLHYRWRVVMQLVSDLR